MSFVDEVASPFLETLLWPEDDGDGNNNCDDSEILEHQRYYSK